MPEISILISTCSMQKKKTLSVSSKDIAHLPFLLLSGDEAQAYADAHWWIQLRETSIISLYFFHLKTSFPQHCC